MQYLNEFLIELKSLEIKSVVYTEKNVDLEEIEFSSIDLSHYDEESTTYAQRLDRLIILAEADILSLGDVSIKYHLNRLLLYKKRLGHLLEWCINEIELFEALARDESNKIIRFDDTGFDKIEFIMDDMVWILYDVLITNLPLNQIPLGFKYDVNTFIPNNSVTGVHTDLYNLIKLRHTKLTLFIDSIKSMTGIEPKLFATDEEVKEQLQLSEKPRPFGLLHSLNASQITALYEALKDKYIASDTTLEQFQALFDIKVTKMVTPINWKGDTHELVYLLNHSFNTSRWQTYLEKKEAFKNRGGTLMTASNYSSYKSSMPEHRTFEPLKAIIEGIKKY